MIKYLLLFVLFFIFPFFLNAIYHSMISSLGNKKRVRKEVKKTFRQKLSESLSYLISVKRERKKLFIFIDIYLGSLLFYFVSFFFSKYLITFLLLSFSPFVSFAVAMNLAKEGVQKRETLFSRLITVKRSKMGLTSESKTDYVLNDEFKVLEWEDDGVTAKKIRISIPATFDDLRVMDFMTQINLTIGEPGTIWVDDYTDPDYPGWNFKSGYATIKTSPPLPEKAGWSEKWLDPSMCAWSFFPVALGTQGGTKMVDPETGEEVTVLGFDVMGLQQKLAKKNGFFCDDSLIASPMTLVSGATGSGKALAVDTKVLISN